MRVKFFTTRPRGPVWTKYDPVVAIEDAINAWLAANPGVRITAVHQSVASWGPIYLVSVWYEPNAEPGAAADGGA